MHCHAKGLDETGGQRSTPDLPALTQFSVQVKWQSTPPANPQGIGYQTVIIHIHLTCCRPSRVCLELCVAGCGCDLLALLPLLVLALKPNGT